MLSEKSWHAPRTVRYSAVFLQHCKIHMRLHTDTQTRTSVQNSKRWVPAVVPRHTAAPRPGKLCFGLTPPPSLRHPLGAGWCIHAHKRKGTSTRSAREAHARETQTRILPPRRTSERDCASLHAALTAACRRACACTVPCTVYRRWRCTSRGATPCESCACSPWPGRVGCRREATWPP